MAVWGLGFGAVPVAAQSWMARAMPADLEGGLALFVSALQGSLAAGSAASGVIYDAKGPGGALVLAAAISSPPAGPAELARAAPGSASTAARHNRWSRKTAPNEHAEVAVRGHTQAAARKELLCPTRS